MSKHVGNEATEVVTVANLPRIRARFDQCAVDCTTDCGHCKGRPVEALRAYGGLIAAERDRYRAEHNKARAKVARLTAKLARQAAVIEAAKAWASDGPSPDGWRIPASPDHIEALLAAVDALEVPDA